MAGFDLKEFRGYNRARDARLLDPSEAVEATNCFFDGSGALRSYHQPWVNVHSFGVLAQDPMTIFRYDTGAAIQWHRWGHLEDVEISRGPSLDDPLKRVYVTDGTLPKMTHKNIAPTYKTLGVPAPATKSTTSASLPTTAIAGAITSVTCPSLKMIHEVKKGRGRGRGGGQATVLATETPVSLTTLPVGARVKVSSIVDANNVQITGVGDIGYACAVDKRSYGLVWTNGIKLWSTRYKAYWNFLVPGGATLAIASHGLQVGDIIQISAVSAEMAWPFATLTTSPTSDQSSRTATTGSNIVFSGNCSFLIERGGETIDPLVPQQNYVIEQRVYVYTQVTDIGEESAPSPASDILSVAVGDPVTVNGFAAAPGGYSITHRRLYRSNTGSDGTELQFVVELPVATTSYVDTKDPSELGEVIPSESWLMPPSNLRGIIALPNGSMAGFYDNFLCFSEPGYPHAWPAEYRYPIDYDIVGIAAFGNSVFAGTKGNPYVFSGAHPRQMGPRRIPVSEPCLGRTSPLNIGDRVTYVSPNGVIAVSEDSVTNITKDNIPEEEWRALVMGVAGNAAFNIRGYFYNNTLEYTWVWDGFLGSPFISLAFNGDRIDFCDGGRAEYRGFFEPSDGTIYRMRTQVSDGAVRVQKLLIETKQDTVAVGGASAYWDGTFNTDWTSKRIPLDRPSNMAWARVVYDYDGDADPAVWSDKFLSIRFRFYLHNRVIKEFTAQPIFFAEPAGNEALFRLPEGYLADAAQVTIFAEGGIAVKRLQVGETIEDVL